MTRIGKLRELTAEQLSMALTSMNEDGDFIPLLMPSGLIESGECIDGVIRAQANWLCEEYQEGDFGLWTVKKAE